MSYKVLAPTQVSPLVEVVAKAALATATYVGAKAERTVISVTEIVKVSPFGVLPAVEFEGQYANGAAAVKFIAASSSEWGFYPKCPAGQLKVDQYFQAAAVFLDLVQALADLEKAKSTDNDKINALNKIVAFLKPLNATLVENTWILGNTFSVADVYLAVAFAGAFSKYFGPKKRTELSAVSRWFTTVANQKVFVKLFGLPTLLDKDVYLMPDLTNLASAKPEKVVDPFAALGKSELHLDTVKKLHGRARPYYPEFAAEFWPIYDHAGYECYEVTFKYNADEWNKQFLCENGVNGFVNRADAAKKYAFVVLNMYQVGEFFHIKGAAVVRGNKEFNNKEIPLAFATVGDADEYSWERIDVSTDAGKKQFIDLFCADTMNGTEIIERIHIK